MNQIKTTFSPDLTAAAAIYNGTSKFSMKPFLEQRPTDFFGLGTGRYGCI